VRTRQARARADADEEGDEEEDGSEPEESDDDLSGAGGMEELLNRANLELGAAIRTAPRTTNTGTVAEIGSFMKTLTLTVTGDYELEPKISLDSGT
jgi:hypothetical protein